MKIYRVNFNFTVLISENQHTVKLLKKKLAIQVFKVEVCFFCELRLPFKKNFSLEKELLYAVIICWFSSI